jgi:hypothetical protein
LCGYEIKNRDFTGFARGGSKGLWLCTGKKPATGLVLAEIAIGALSHAALFLPRIPATAPSVAAHQARGRPSVGRSQLLKIFFRMSTILPTVIYKSSIILRK